MRIEEASFAELLSSIVDNRGRTCPTAKDGVPLIATNCIRNDALYPVFERVRFVDEETYRTWFRGHPQPGDLIFVCKGSPGRVCMTPDPVPFCIAQDMVAIRADEQLIYPKYLFAALRSPVVQERIAGLHVGSLIPHFKKGDFDKLSIPLPDRDDQVVIGDSYFDLSLAMELNRQTIDICEKMARAFFQAWFVDFEPVKAKAEGATGFPGMPQDVFDHLPRCFEETEHGVIPQGWNLRSVENVCTFNYGKALKAASRNAGDIPVYGSNGIVGWHDEALVSGPGIVVGRKGNPGTVNWVDSDFFPIDTTFYITSELPLPYLRYGLEELDLGRFGSDSAVPGLSRKLAYGLPLLVPNDDVMVSFADVFNCFRAMVSTNQEECRILTALRDALLPKLISGEVTVMSNGEMNHGG